MNLLVITRLPIIDASTRQRIHQFEEIFSEDYDIHLTFSPFYSNEQFINYRKGKLGKYNFVKCFFRRFVEIFSYKKYDAIWILRSVAPIEMPWILKIMNKMNIPVIYEFDDAIFLGEKATRMRTKLTRSWEKVHKYAKRADKIIVGNDMLKNWASTYNQNVCVVPTGIDIKDYLLKDDFISRDKFTIGWIGSVSTAPNLELILPAIEAVSKEIKIKLVIIGGTPLSIDNDIIEYLDIPWSLEEQKELLKGFDVGVAPLYDTPFNNGKCAYKIIQYMATGLPVIASSVGVQTEIINKYNNGFIATNTDEWVQAFLILAKNIEMQKEMGRASRLAAEEDFDIRVLAKKIVDVLKK